MKVNEWVCNNKYERVTYRAGAATGVSSTNDDGT
jgi:hypothetical protein